MKFNTVCVVGGAGAVGRLFCKILLNEYSHVVVLDLKCDESSRVEGVEYIEADITDAKSYSILKRAELILLALPEDPAIASIKPFSQFLKAGQCLVDTTSVKSRIVENLNQINSDVEVMSINPMFGPSLGFKNQSVACIEINCGPFSTHFLNLIKKAGASIVSMSAVEHDKYTAITQAITHAAILSFGMSLGKMDYSPDSAKPIWTPPHKTLLSLLARMLNADSEVYRDIQSSNPFAQEARKALIESFVELDKIISSDKPEQFAKLFKELNLVLENNKEELVDNCQKIYE